METTATNIVILSAGILGGIVAARGLGPAGRGQLAIYAMWGMLLQSMLGLGVPSALTFFSASDPDSQGRLWQYYRQRLMPGISLLVGAGVLLLYAGFIGLGRASAREAAIFAAWSPFAQISEASASFLQGIGRFWRFNAVRLVGGVGPPAGVLLLAAAGGLSVGKVGLAYGLAALLASAAGLHWLSSVDEKSESPLSPSSGFWKYSIQSMMSSAVVSANARADLFVLSVLVSRAELGVYTVASSATLLLVPFVSGVSVVTFQRIASSRTTRGRWLIVRRSLTGVVLGSTVASLALALAAPVLIRAVFGPGYSDASRPAQALALGGVFICSNNLLGHILRGMGSPVVVVVGQAVGAFATSVSVLLAANHSLAWVAIASTLGYGLTTAWLGAGLRRSLRRGE